MQCVPPKGTAFAGLARKNHSLEEAARSLRASPPYCPYRAAVLAKPRQRLILPFLTVRIQTQPHWINLRDSFIQPRLSPGPASSTTNDREPNTGGANTVGGSTRNRTDHNSSRADSKLARKRPERESAMAKENL